MILSNEDILNTCKNSSSIVIEPFSEELLQPASYDLRVGDQAASSAKKEVLDLTKTGFIEITPGDFVIMLTHEKLTLDLQHTARFGLTSSYARKGLIATVGPQVDPGFEGRLIIGLTNLSSKPIIVPHKDRFLTVEFHRLHHPSSTLYECPYQGRDKLSPEDIKIALEREYMSQTEMMRTLQALVSTVKDLKQTVNWKLPLVLGGIMLLGFTLLGIMGAALIAFMV